MKPLLTLTPDEMRRAGYAVIDRLVEHFATLPEQSPWGAGEAPGDGAFAGPPPREGRAFEDVLNALDRDLFPYGARVNHPRFYSFVPGPSNFVSVLADTLASGFNIFNGTWIGSSGGAELERATIGWVRDAIGMPSGAGGLFTSGGSMANVIGLATARTAMLGGGTMGARAYASTEIHASVDKALRLLGFGPDQFRKIPCDDQFRMEPQALRRAVAEDRAAGLKPFCVIASSGTTNTGAVDPLTELADVCDGENLWLHVDGAYGASAVFSDRGKRALEGLDRAHSLSFDPHKWLFQPYEIGGVLVREARWLHKTFDVSASYMRDTKGLTRGVNFCEYGVQLTRSLRALKLWMTFQVFGADEIARAVEHGFELAEEAEALIRKMPDWRLVSPASMAVLSFRAAPTGVSNEAADRLNSEIAARVRAEGEDMIVTTQLGGRVALRMCTINPRTTPQDIAAAIRRLDAHARAAANERANKE